MVGFNFDNLDDDIPSEEMTEEDFDLENGVYYVDETEAIYWEKYKNMSLSERIDRYNESHENPEVWEKLAEYYVKPHQSFTKEIRSELITTIENAKDEKDIQIYLKKYPFVLTTAVQPAHHAQICIPKPKLGNQLEPDFFIAGMDSAGFWWYGVELESPQFRMFNKDGEETRELKHAIKQIQEWRSWLKANIAYARDTLGYKHIDADLPCFIFIGKRENEVIGGDYFIDRRQQLKSNDKHGLFVHHYEWLLDKPPTIIRVEE